MLPSASPPAPTETHNAPPERSVAMIPSIRREQTTATIVSPHPPPRIPRLPREILDTIFQYALADIPPRLVKVQHTIAKDENGVPIPRQVSVCSGLTCQFTSPWIIPPLLHACVRSRYQAMKRWPLCFSKRGRRAWDPVEAPRIFFDMGRDTLYLGEGSKVEVLREWIKQFGTREERAKVQYLAVELKNEGLGMGLDDDEGASLARIIKTEFTGLVEIMFGVEDIHKVKAQIKSRHDGESIIVRSDVRVYCAFLRAKSQLRWEVLHHLVPQLRLDLGDWYFENGHGPVVK